MKFSKLIFTAAFLLIASSAFTQSRSFQVLQENFMNNEDVHCFRFSGFLCRTVFWMADEWEFKEAIKDVKSIQLITIPRHRFAEAELSLNGFRKYVERDNFVSLAKIKENRDQVEIYLQQSGNKKDRYLVLIEDSNDVTVVEVKGYIDVDKLKEKDAKLSYSK